MDIPSSRVDEIEFGGQKFFGKDWRKAILHFLEAWNTRDMECGRRPASALRVGPVTLRKIVSDVSYYVAYRSMQTVVPQDDLVEAQPVRLAIAGDGNGRDLCGSYDFEAKLAWLAGSDRGSDSRIPCRLRIFFRSVHGDHLGRVTLTVVDDVLLVRAECVPSSAEELLDEIT